jgi:hypothetical protein
MASIKQGQCHCGAVKVQVAFEDDPEVRVVCRDEGCVRYGQQLYFVNKKRFSLLEGASELSVYQPEAQSLKLLFCRTCGQQTHLRWLGDDTIGVNRRLIDEIPAEIIEQPCELCGVARSDDF